MNKLIKNLIKDFLRGLLIAVIIIGFLYIGKETETYALYLSSGASIEPYCLNCLGFYVNIKPSENSWMVYNTKFNDIDIVAVHPFLYESNDKYYACVNPYKDLCFDVDIINKEDYRGRVIFELPIETTEDFLLSCLKELDGSKYENKIEYCKTWELEYNKFKESVNKNGLGK